MRPKVYLETSFVSYLAAQLSQDLMMLQRQLSSHRWWETKRSQFDRFVSQTVYEDCWEGNPEYVRARTDILKKTAPVPLDWGDTGIRDDIG
jgi:hypothetical protein